ncbi:MAG: Asp-tRNA(Asn)/Glu-tRNA(Gln) amidotransferase subunit GatC [Ottowia sp.]|jgi:aspartyl-tRNA(Asn)/glutamyl-tRNA(Gln) amidotransferase subunit C|nr:Asp-tRNA(Asn)/Glu-tRNA(Gln) amidotransferase subunit GatC [Ottowia sp.]
MTLKPSDITALARLSRIAITPQENAQALEQINHFFTLVEQIQAVDTQGVTALSHPIATRHTLTQRLRDDAVTEPTTLTTRVGYQVNAPKTEDGLYLVPRVVE